jgi:hypothetical protein
MSLAKNLKSIFFLQIFIQFCKNHRQRCQKVSYIPPRPPPQSHVDLKENNFFVSNFLADETIRLVGGRGRFEGNVFVRNLKNGKLGPVCHDHWDINDVSFFEAWTTDRQTDIETERQREMDRRIDGQTDRQTHTRGYLC